ncbi:MAG: hypothetical protein GWN62_12850, partial [Aliifodinibius sp.]|nr:hypothetical protein [Fodinibius sp.]
MTLALQVENKASGSLDSGISASATSLTLKAGEGAEFPSASGDNYFYVTLQTAGGAWEVVKVTAKVSNTFTIERNVDSSTGAAQAFSADDIVSLRYCASVISDIVDELNDHADDHDSRFFTETEHINTSVGAADAGKPIKLDSGGFIDDSMINEAGINHSNITDDESEKHR